MIFRSACVLSFAILAGATHGAECRLDHAHYVEPVSGATMQFHAKSVDDATLTMAVFDLGLPNVAETYPGDITWNNGHNPRPDATIKDFPGVSGAYAVDTGKVGLIDDIDMLAPQSILIVDFGRALFNFAPFVEANPDKFMFDVFNLTGCP